MVTSEDGNSEAELSNIVTGIKHIRTITLKTKIVYVQVFVVSCEY